MFFYSMSETDDDTSFDDCILATNRRLFAVADKLINHELQYFQLFRVG